MRIAPDRVAFDAPGMGLTRNGVAQGYIADRGAALLVGEGVSDAPVEAG